MHKVLVSNTHSSTHIRKEETSKFQSEKSEMWPNRKTSNKEAMVQVLPHFNKAARSVIHLRRLKMQLTSCIYNFRLPLPMNRLNKGVSNTGCFPLIENLSIKISMTLNISFLLIRWNCLNSNHRRAFVCFW